MGEAMRRALKPSASLMLALVALVAASCSKPSEVPVSARASASAHPSAPPSATSSAASVLPSTSPASSATAMRPHRFAQMPRPAAYHPDPATFACGDKRCASGKASCCPNENIPDCVAATAASANDWSAYEPECKQAQPHSGYMDDVWIRCDESQDCGDKEACCFKRLGEHSSAWRCLPLEKNGRSPCPGEEICISGGPPCRTRGADCVANPGSWLAPGFCRKLAKNLKCGAATCSGDTSACCGDPPTCRAPADCAPKPGGDYIVQYTCATHTDCLDGEWCISDPEAGGRSCTATLPFKPCERAPDCFDFCNEKRATCGPYPAMPQMKSCACAPR